MYVSDAQKAAKTILVSPCVLSEACLSGAAKLGMPAPKVKTNICSWNIFPHCVKMIASFPSVEPEMLTRRRVKLSN